MKRKSNRIVRINEEIKHELSLIISRELKDPRINQMTSVMRVETTSDLKHCKVYISVFGNDESVEGTKIGLESSSGYIRKELAKRINLRNTPELHFVIDRSIEYGMHISKLIDGVIRQDEQEKNDEV